MKADIKMNVNVMLTPAEANEIEIINLTKNAKITFLEIGGLLAENYDKGYWSQCGHESFREFVEALGIGSYSWCTRLIAIARIVAHNILTEDEVLEIGTAKTCLLLPRVIDGKLDTDLVALAKNCPYHTLRVELGQAKQEEELSEEYLLCPRCGARILFQQHLLRR